MQEIFSYIASIAHGAATGIGMFILASFGIEGIRRLKKRMPRIFKRKIPIEEATGEPLPIDKLEHISEYERIMEDVIANGWLEISRTPVGYALTLRYKHEEQIHRLDAQAVVQPMPPPEKEPEVVEDIKRNIGRQMAAQLTSSIIHHLPHE